MTPTILVNKLTIVHKKSDGKALSSAPDFCKTPVGSAIVPIPYINVAYSKHLKKGSKTVRTDGASAAIKNCEFSTSFGDEPGVQKGVASGTNKGWAKFSNYSFDVFIEGKNACRLSDPMQMNGNNPNTMTAAELQKNIGPDHILCKIFCWCENGGNGGDFFKPGYPSEII